LEAYGDFFTNAFGHPEPRFDCDSEGVVSVDELKFILSNLPVKVSSQGDLFDKAGANPTIESYIASAVKIYNASAVKIYNASAVKIYNPTSSRVRCKYKNSFFCFEKRSSLLQRWWCAYLVVHMYIPKS
jgi:hypothetical protein